MGGSVDGGDNDEVDSLFSSELQEARARLSEIGLLEGARGFREDLEEMYVEEGEKQYTLNEKKQVRQFGIHALSSAGKIYHQLDRGVQIVNIIEILGVAVLFAATYISLSIPDVGLSNLVTTGLSLGFSILMWLLGRGILYGKATTEELAYKRLSHRLSSERLHFRASWNKSVLQSPWTFLGVIIVGLIRSFSRSRYNIGMKRLRKKASEKWKED